MACHLEALCFDALDPDRLATFWAGVLNWAHTGSTLTPTDDTGFALRFLPTEEPKTVANQVHFDLTSQSAEHQQETVARVLALGGSHLDIGQGEVDHVVMSDPEGNELCVIETGNRFLAGCPLIGALSSDGTQALGYFWAQALGWPLVWDQDEETAIRSPHGGSIISWGGPPLAPKAPRTRLRLAVSTDDPEQLLLLGAQRIDETTYRDPDGNEFLVYLR
jgi:hypothetical protein